jgi:O-antigen/teichoic acid export membrane protein
LKTTIQRLWNSPTFWKVANNAGFLALERVFRLMAALFVGAAVGRYLGAERFGTFSAVLSLCTLLALSSDLGIARVVVRDLVSGNKAPGTLMGTAVALRVGASALISTITVIAVLLIHGRAASVPVTLGLLFSVGFFLRSSDVLDLGFQAVTEGRYPAFARMFSLVCGAALQLWLIQRAASMQAFGVAFAAESLLISMGMFAVWKRYAPPAFRRWKFDPSTARQLISESWPMFVASLYSQVYYRADVIFLERLSSSYNAGIYTASARIYDILIGVLPLLGVSIFPTLTRWYQKDRKAFTRRYTQLTQWITWGAALGLALTWFLRHHIVRFIFGPDFAGAADVLPWHLASALIMYHSLFRAAYLTLAQRQILLLWTSLLGALVNVALNLVLIPKLGAQGAAIAGTLTQITALVLSNAFAHDTRWMLKVTARTMLIPVRSFSCPETITAKMNLHLK